MSCGWIKLHRSLLQWEWATSSNHFIVFMILLLKANHKKTHWRGETLNPGDLLTGLPQLAEWTGLSISKIRTVLKDLENSKEIRRQVTAKYSIITITKWDQYQGDDSQIAVKSQADRSQIATSNNVNNINNVKNVFSEKTISPDEVLDLWNLKHGEKFGYCPGIGSGKHRENILEAIKYLKTAKDWENVFNKATNSEFLTGNNKFDWTVNFLWLIDYDNALKVLSDNFDDQKIVRAIQAEFLQKVQK